MLPPAQPRPCSWDEARCPHPATPGPCSHLTESQAGGNHGSPWAPPCMHPQDIRSLFKTHRVCLCFLLRRGSRLWLWRLTCKAKRGSSAPAACSTPLWVPAGWQGHGWGWTWLQTWASKAGSLIRAQASPRRGDQLPERPSPEQLRGPWASAVPSLPLPLLSPALHPMRPACRLPGLLQRSPVRRGPSSTPAPPLEAGGLTRTTSLLPAAGQGTPLQSALKSGTERCWRGPSSPLCTKSEAGSGLQTAQPRVHSLKHKCIRQRQRRASPGLVPSAPTSFSAWRTGPWDCPGHS